MRKLKINTNFNKEKKYAPYEQCIDLGCKNFQVIHEEEGYAEPHCNVFELLTDSDRSGNGCSLFDPTDLFKNNKYCPDCGRIANQEIRSCESGLSYCSNECAKIHVNEVYCEEEVDNQHICTCSEIDSLIKEKCTTFKPKAGLSLDKSVLCRICQFNSSCFQK